MAVAGEKLMAVDNLRGAELNGVDLSYANLAGSTVAGADLSVSEFRSTRLAEVDFRHACLVAAMHLSAVAQKRAAEAGAALYASSPLFLRYNPSTRCKHKRSP